MMRMLCRYTLFLFLCFVANAAQAQVDTAAMVFDKLRSRLNGIDDYKADVKVKIDVSFMKIPPLAGTLYFKAPDKMKLERRGGISILPKKNTNLTLNSMFPIGDATVIDAGKGVIDGRDVRIIKVIPQDDAGQIILTKIWVDEKRNLALRTETTTRNNGTVKMDLFFEKHVSTGLPDKVIVYLDVKEYKLPKGVTMDYDSEQIAKANSNKKNKKGKIEIYYLSYELNNGISDDFFIEKK